MAQQPVYRKAALDKLSSPEELDRLMRITSPGSWLTLSAFGVVLVMVLLWSIFGQITTTLKQSGILTLSYPITFITAPEAGQVINIVVDENEFVAAGDIIAHIAVIGEIKPVLAPASGRVVSVRVNIADPVDAGTPLLSLAAHDQVEQRHEVVLYVPLEDRHQLRVGMKAQVLPSTVERENYGYIEGEVYSVSESAATRDEMLASLGDESFVNSLMSAGFMFEIRIVLWTDPDGEWVWSASDGPDVQILTGTPCSVIVNVDSERPINKVFNLG